MTALAINTDTWEALACDRCAWRPGVQRGLSSCEDTLMHQVEEKEPTESLSPRQTGQPAHSAVHSAIETVTPALGSATTADAVLDSSTIGATP